MLYTGWSCVVHFERQRHRRAVRCSTAAVGAQVNAAPADPERCQNTQGSFKFFDHGLFFDVKLVLLQSQISADCCSFRILNHLLLVSDVWERCAQQGTQHEETTLSTEFFCKASKY